MGTAKILGIDFSRESVMISYYADNLKEPATVSIVNGSQIYQIPLCVCKKAGIGQWFFGDEAIRMSKREGTACVDLLLERAIAGESVELEGEMYLIEDLFFLYFKKITALTMTMAGFHELDKLVLSVEKITPDLMKFFWMFFEKTSFSVEDVIFIDYQESFYYYALSQSRELTLHEQLMFQYQEESIRMVRLTHNTRTLPQTVFMEEAVFSFTEEDKDEQFLEIVEQCTAGHLISAVYLIGEGFEGEWMKKSLPVLCKGKRVFMGKNLYSKGACYAGKARLAPANWKYLYEGVNEVRLNISLKMVEGKKTTLHSLISAGRNWYETVGECEVILAGKPSIDFWLQLPESREAKVRTLDLKDFPVREDMTTRLRITARPQSADEVMILIKDLGFGEIQRSSEKTWEYLMQVK